MTKTLPFNCDGICPREDDRVALGGRPALFAAKDYEASMWAALGRVGDGEYFRWRAARAYAMASYCTSLGDSAEAEEWLKQAEKSRKAYELFLSEMDRGVAHPSVAWDYAHVRLSAV